MFKQLAQTRKAAHNLFYGRDMVVATMHGKDLVIGPLFKRRIGVEPFLPSEFNTDQFGTFSGEVERGNDPLSVCREKCLKAMEHTGATLGVASEGSFRPHPEVPFITVDEEWMVFIDAAHDLEISTRVISTATNFNSRQVSSWDEMKSFIRTAIFPTHSLILKATGRDLHYICKGIDSHQKLEYHFEDFLKRFGGAVVETDMRAHHNPSRMKVIEQTALQLAQAIESCCPQCQTPGFGVKHVHRGLPCRICGTPTRSVLAHHLSCKKCGFEKEHLHPYGNSSEDPMYCDYCNP